MINFFIAIFLTLSFCTKADFVNGAVNPTEGLVQSINAPKSAHHRISSFQQIRQYVSQRIIKNKFSKKNADKKFPANLIYIAGHISVIAFILSLLTPFFLVVAIPVSIFAIIAGSAIKKYKYNEKELKKIRTGRITGIVVLFLIAMLFLIVWGLVSLFAVN